MNIAIIGGGSIGLLYSFYLNKTHEVTLYTRTDEQANLLNEEGIQLVDGGLTTRQMVTARSIEEWEGKEEITVITVKEYQLSSLMPLITEQINEDGCLFFLQNGMGHLKRIAKLKWNHIYVGSVEHGAAKMNGNTVAHNGHGVTRCAVYQGSATQLKKLINTTTSDFSFAFEQDYHEMLIRKLLVNAVINPLTATLMIPNGVLLSNPYFYELASQLFAEVATVLTIHNKESHFEHIVAVCNKTATNRSSMLKDIEEGRKTEVDAILGYLNEVAMNNEINTPLIRHYYQLIKGKEFEKGGL
ncbi:2-dehydropantoate 2-reductase [Bacillus sp. B15-48]|uniref:2-dehydropantoate 2-reductase n=1 Tax=Bacillus sp. B15-48 TaxID=1548601 RepID=UPI00193F29AB|nr:2-dehydropantoate 2-reductase [Bacillus sp. B15-48]MBM4764033.1 2-dehydropantoate 2-reductase [Bacillus sp. B15-48]